MNIKDVIAKGLAVVIPALVILLLMLYAGICLSPFLGKWFFYSMMLAALPISIIVGGYIAEKVAQKEVKRK